TELADAWNSGGSEYSSVTDRGVMLASAARIDISGRVEGEGADELRFDGEGEAGGGFFGAPGEGERFAGDGDDVGISRDAEAIDRLSDLERATGGCCGGERSGALDEVAGAGPLGFARGRA